MEPLSEVILCACSILFLVSLKYSSVPLEDTIDGDKRLTMHDGKAFRFVSQPSTEHLKKMKDHRIEHGLQHP